MKIIKKLSVILAVSGVVMAQSHTIQPTWFERNVNGVMIGGLAAIHALRFATINYAIGGQQIEDGDPFKIMVQEEFADMGITDTKSYFIKISAHPMIENSFMITLPGGIIVANSLYEAYKQPQSDKDAVRFLVRHEAAHFKNGDFYKRIAFNLALYAGLIYGSDYLINKAEQRGYLPERLKSFNAKCLLKTLIGEFDGVLTNYFCIYNQEYNADQKAATTAALAAGGSRAMGRLAEANKKMGSLENWVQSKPGLWRTLTGYQTHADRSKTLAEIANQLKVQAPFFPPCEIKDPSLDRTYDLSVAVAYELLDDDFYQSIFENIEQEIGIKILGSDKYADEVAQYKKNLVNCMASYVQEIYSEAELSEMIADENAVAWEKLVSPDFQKIIKQEVGEFVAAVNKK